MWFVLTNVSSDTFGTPRCLAMKGMGGSTEGMGMGSTKGMYHDMMGLDSMKGKSPMMTKKKDSDKKMRKSPMMKKKDSDKKMMKKIKSRRAEGPKGADKLKKKEDKSAMGRSGFFDDAYNEFWSRRCRLAFGSSGRSYRASSESRHGNPPDGSRK